MLPDASLDLLCLGEPLMELNQVRGVDHYLPGFGGDTSNCAVAAARQGARVGYVTAVGEDTFGNAFLKLWNTEGIDTSCVLRTPDAHTGLYLVSHSKAGHEFSYFRSGSAASRLTPEALPENQIAATRIFHASGISQAISTSACDAVFHALALAQQHRVRISYDPNLRLKLWPLNRARAVIHEAMRQCDIALPGIEDAKLLTGLEQPEAIVEFYLKLGAELVALTLGPEGVLVATTEQQQRILGYAVESVDATGAGDTFDGAFLAELASGRDPFVAARYANAAAALATTGYGAVAPMPTRSQVEAFLNHPNA